MHATPGLLVIEGAALLPELLAALGVPTGRAVWVVPTGALQREHYTRRAWAGDLVERTIDPVAAFEQWMQRDARFAEMVTEQAHAVGYRVLVTDGTTSVTSAAATLTALLSAR